MLFADPNERARSVNRIVKLRRFVGTVIVLAIPAGRRSHPVGSADRSRPPQVTG
jgi:hypothetical protein